jgi:hypothetical protein
VGTCIGGDELGLDLNPAVGDVALPSTVVAIMTRVFVTTSCSRRVWK